MKKTIFMVFACIAVCMLTGCDYFSRLKYSGYQEACMKGDFETALSYVAKLEESAMEQDEYNRLIQKNVSAYTTARDYVFDAEMQYLLSDGSEGASDRLIFLLNSLPMKGRKLKEGYTGSDARMALVDGSAFNKDFAWYCESVNSYNEKCRSIMELCISQGNKYLADKIVKLVKETPTVVDGTAIDPTVHYTDDDKVAIKKMYDDAINTGIFK